MKYLYSILMMVTVSACANSVEQSMETLDGLHISKAVKYLGTPDSKEKILGNNIYQWRHADPEASCTITAKTNTGDMIRDMSYVEEDDGCETYLLQAQDIIKQK